MQFENSEFLWALGLLIPLAFFFKHTTPSWEVHFDKDVLKRMRIQRGILSPKIRHALLLASIALGIIALARPVIDNGSIKVNSSDIDMIVGFDISHSMFADDIYPNRFTFAKQKFNTFLQDIKEARIGVIGFSSKAFLVSPLTKDFSSLAFLVKNMKFDYVSLKGTSIQSALEVSQNLLKEQKRKILVLFTDGGDKKDYSQEIAYAKSQGITVYIYAIGTDKGGVIKQQNGVLKDKDGNIVVVKRNDAIKTLALQSGGAYLKASLAKNDIDALAKSILSANKKREKKEHTIRDTKELFVYPLGLAMLLFVLSFSSLPQRRKA